MFSSSFQYPTRPEVSVVEADVVLSFNDPATFIVEEALNIPLETVIVPETVIADGALKTPPP